MSDNYGMKVTLTMVLNDDDYNLGFTFNDTHGTALDKQLNGKINDFEQDIVNAIVEAYLDAARKEKEIKKAVKLESTVDTITAHNMDANMATVDRLSELEKENQRLNDKIDKLLQDKEQEKKNGTDKKKKVGASKEKAPDRIDVKNFDFYLKDINNVLRILGI